MENQLDNIAPGQAETVVGPSVKIQGDLNSEGNIRIEGQVHGKVKTTQNVYVGEAAKIAADILAGSAIVAGEVQGNLKIGSNLIMLATARVVGDISCSILRVEDGAQFSGKCIMNNVQVNSEGGTPIVASAPAPSKRTKAPVITEPEPEE